jgi:DNA-binding NtrC family response regulator
MADASRLAGLAVLVVEDDYYLAEETREALEKAGASVLGPCARLEDAQAVLGRAKPDCAVLDLNLGSGPDFGPARAMLEKGIPVLLVTGYDRAVIPSELSHLPFLQKPASPKKLVEAVSELCSR